MLWYMEDYTALLLLMIVHIQLAFAAVMYNIKNTQHTYILTKNAAHSIIYICTCVCVCVCVACVRKQCNGGWQQQRNLAPHWRRPPANPHTHTHTRPPTATMRRLPVCWMPSLRPRQPDPIDTMHTHTHTCAYTHVHMCARELNGMRLIERPDQLAEAFARTLDGPYTRTSGRHERPPHCQFDVAPGGVIVCRVFGVADRSDTEIRNLRANVVAMLGAVLLPELNSFFFHRNVRTRAH